MGRIFLGFLGGAADGSVSSQTTTYMCTHTTICVLILVYVCPHATIYVKMKEEVGGQSVVCVRVRLYNILLILYYY